MLPHVVTPGHVVRATFTTYVALERFGFLWSFTLVVFEKMERGIFLLTNPTLVLLGLAMGSIVSLEVAFLEEAATTDLTAVRFIAAVCQSVPSQCAHM